MCVFVCGCVFVLATAAKSKRISSRGSLAMTALQLASCAAVGSVRRMPSKIHKNATAQTLKIFGRNNYDTQAESTDKKICRQKKSRGWKCQQKASIRWLWVTLCLLKDSGKFYSSDGWCQSLSQQTYLTVSKFACLTSFYSLKGVLHSYRKAAQNVTNFRQLCVLQVKSVGRQSNFDALNDLLFALSSATCECYPWQLQLVSWYIDWLVAWSIAFPVASLPSFTISQLPWLCRHSRVGQLLELWSTSS